MQTGIIYITITCPVAVEKSCRQHSAGKHVSALAECEQSVRSYRGGLGVPGCSSVCQHHAPLLKIGHSGTGERRNTATKTHVHIFHFSVLPEKVTCTNKREDVISSAQAPATRGGTPSCFISSVTGGVV